MAHQYISGASWLARAFREWRPFRYGAIRSFQPCPATCVLSPAAHLAGARCALVQRAARVASVILWLNGTHGVGKTTTSALMQQLIPDSRVFDAEKVGEMLMDITPGLPETDNFQHWPP